jgi:Secretory lipase
MPELKLDERTVVWGDSQGGHSALWTGIIGPRYTRDIKIVGVAAIAPAANMTNILKINPPVGKRLGPWLAGSYSRFYPDINFERSVRPSGASR